MRYYIGDSDDERPHGGHVRVMLEEIEYDQDLQTILLDSGADAAVFPSSMLDLGTTSTSAVTKLHDAQGREIPVLAMRDVEVHLMDECGRNVILRETVAVSDQVSQPILCFGRLLECGWGIDGRQQALVHEAGGVTIPVELQNRSMTVKGLIRVIKCSDAVQNENHVRAVRAEVMRELEVGPIGWNLDRSGCGVGRHFAAAHQDPTLARPEMTGSKFRTTLVKGDNGHWYISELCEPLDTMADLNSTLHEFEGNRNVITIISDAEKAPELLGFRFAEDDPEIDDHAHAHDVDIGDEGLLAPEDEDTGPGVEVGDVHQGGAEIPVGHLAEAARNVDSINVNGVDLTRDSALNNLRDACGYYKLSTSGSKARCFSRLLEHAKKLELQVILAAARAAEQEALRVPRAPHLAEPPDLETQEKHALTHVPYQPWCESCVAFRARQDRHIREDITKRADTPTVSFDLFFTRANEADLPDPAVDTLLGLVMVDSKTGYVGCVPLKSKGQFDLMVREVVSFCALLGYGEVTFMCDNEPTMVQLQKMVINTRQSMGLVSRATTSPAYDHENSLAENAIGRVRPMAGTLMHNLGQKLGMSISTSSPLWSWSLRHACWLINRYAVLRGATPYELAFGKTFDGQVCQFGEPVYAYAKTSLKGNAKWQRMIMLGKLEAQNSFVLFNGSAVVLSKSVRRIRTGWKNHLAFYVHFNAPTWVYKSGYGARVKLTKNPRETKSASFEVPLGPIQASKLVDEDAEAVRMKAEDEKMEDQELTGMAVNDPLLNKPVQMEATEQKELVEVDEDIEIPTTMPSRTVPPAGMNVFDDPEPPSVAEQARSSAGSVGMRVPVVPIDVPTGVEAASSSSTRGHGDEVQGGSEPKKPRVESHKKQKINMLIQEHATCVRMVKFGDEVHHTMDDYSTDLVVDSTDLSLYEPYELATTDVDKAVNDDWCQEEEIQFNETPEGVWSDEPLEVIPGQPPAWVDKLADEIEIERLASMKVLERAETYAGSVSDKATLTTKFVYDWRVKMYTPPGGTEVQSRKRWMRRSRFVAREFAAGDKRDDVYSPATSNHTANLLQLVYLEKLSQAELASLGADSQYGVTLASMDIKDAFLQVDQEEPTQVLLHGRSYVLLKNLPGQRLGAKAWYWCLRNFMSSGALNSPA